MNLLRSKNFDIAIDLMGFTSDNKLEFFKERIAPIQISWLGYCNTSGIDEIDFLIADKNLIYQERKIYMLRKLFIYRKFGIVILELKKQELKKTHHF